MAKTTQIRDVLIMKLQSLYDMEKQIESALPAMEAAATNAKLKEGFSMHLLETRGQITRLEEAFTIAGEEPDPKPLQGIRGIILDGIEIMALGVAPEIKDALIAGAARDVEHYEMAGYMGAIGISQAAGDDSIAKLLMLNLSQEMAADEKLKMVAQESLGMFATD